LSCRYDLRGLSPAANCPECNAPVRLSIELPSLRCASLEWLRGVEWGLRPLLFVTAGAPLLLILCVILCTTNARFLRAPRKFSGGQRRPRGAGATLGCGRRPRCVIWGNSLLAALLITAAGSAVAAGAVWILTRRVNEHVPAGWVARGGAVASVVALAPLGYMLKQ
jgi:hypothetical protein